MMTASQQVHDDISEKNDTTACGLMPHADSIDLQRPLGIDVVPADGRAAVLRDWKQLESRLADVPLAASACWTETWLKHYGDLIPHRFVRAHSGDSLVGLCLLTDGVQQSEGPLPIRTLHLGTAGEPEADSVCVKYNALLCEDSRREEFLTAIIGYAESQRDWDELRLDGFTSADVSILQRDPRMQSRIVESYYFDLQAARDATGEVLTHLGQATRKNVRRNLKWYGDLKTEWAEDVGQAESIFDDLMRLHQSRWTAVGQPGAYASRRFESFHRELLQSLIPAGRMVLFRVSSADGIVGCVQAFIDGNRALVYQGGSAPYTGKLSPGMIVDYLCMEECLRRGLDAYDFLGGNSEHKQKLSNGTNQLAWIRCCRPRWKYRIVNAARHVKRGMAALSALHRRLGPGSRKPACDSVTSTLQ